MDMPTDRVPESLSSAFDILPPAGTDTKKSPATQDSRLPSPDSVMRARASVSTDARSNRIPDRSGLALSSAVRRPPCPPPTSTILLNREKS